MLAAPVVPNFFTMLAPLVALLPLAWLMVRDARRLWRSVRLIQRGRYAESRATHARIGRSWLRIFPSVRQASRYGVALTYHMEGHFERALEELAAIERASLDRNLTYGVASLEATSLILAERDLSRAATLLDQAALIHRPPEDILCLAHARHGLGDARAVEELLAKAGVARRGGTLHASDPAHHEAIFHTMRGLLLVKLGREEEARADFERAASVPLHNWYTQTARALLPTASDDADPPGSLAPTVSET